MEIIPQLPGDLQAGILIVQHMPGGFTSSLAERLDERSKLEVKEAVNGDEILPGKVLVAPGGQHIFYEEIERRPSVTLLPRNDTQRTACPSIDFAFSSIAPFLKSRMIGVILTGMGRDGLSGSAVIRKFGGRVIVQDPETCIVKGMPGSIVNEGQQHVIAPLDGMARVITEEVNDVVMEKSIDGC
jgi:two-component system chemotaxis response regulator CheB